MATSGLDFIEVGHRVTFAKTVGETDVTLFAGITGDFSPTHVNDQYMREKTNLGGRIAHGALIIGFMSTVQTTSIAHVVGREDLDDFPVSAGYDKVRFLKPVRLGDTVTVDYQVVSIDRDRGRSVGRQTAVNQHGETVAVAEHVMRWARKLTASGPGA